MVARSALSVVPSGVSALALYRDDRLVAQVSCTTSPAVVVLHFDVAGHPTVSRGDLLDPVWRRWLATDLRLAYERPKAERARLIRLLTDTATAWDAR